MDDYFHIVSRLVILAPLVVIVIALFFKFSNANYKSFSTNLPSPTIAQSVLSTSTTLKIDLNGPFVCQVTVKGATLSAFIKNKKIAARFDKQNYLLRDDCLYIWDQGTFSGQEICGLGNYINMAETFLSQNLLNMNTVLSYLRQINQAPNAIQNSSNLESLVNSCKEMEITDISVFDLPQSVLFKNKSK